MPIAEPKQKIRRKKVRFVYYAPKAEQVLLAGTFNGWNAANSLMKKMSDGYWEKHLLLRPGRHEYRYFVDGVWANDQRDVEQVPNDFGGQNSVVTVSE